MPVSNVKAESRTSDAGREECSIIPQLDRREYESNLGVVRGRIKDIKQELDQLRILQRSRSSDVPQRSASFNSEEQVVQERGRLTKEKEDLAKVQKDLEEKQQRVSASISNKRDQSTRLKSNLQYSTEEQHTTAIRKLEEQLATKQYSAVEEGKIKSDVEEVKQSKEKLQERDELEEGVKHLKEQQEQIRDEKKVLFQQMSRIRSREQNIVHYQRSMSDQPGVAMHSMTEAQLQERRAVLRQEMEALTLRSSQLTQEFKSREAEYIKQLDLQKRMMKKEKEKKVEEKKLKEVERKSREVLFKRVEGPSDLSLAEVQKAHSICKTLVGLLEKSVKVDPVDSFVAADQVDSSEDRSGTGSDQSDDRKQKKEDWKGAEGVFLKKTQEDEHTYYQSRQNPRRKSKKDKSKQLNAKPAKRLPHSPLMIQQFDILEIPPPATLKDVPATLEALRERMDRLGHKLTTLPVDLIGGVDSGIMSVEHSDSEYTGF